jgi:lysozyme
MSIVGLKEQLVRDEGFVEHAYEDSLGYLTIGVGHLIDKRRGGELPRHIIEALLQHDITQKTAELYGRFSWVIELDEVRRATLVNMAFQLGVDGLAQFARAMAYMRNGEYNAAAIAFADSKVAREQTPERWRRHCQQIRTGEWQ